MEFIILALATWRLSSLLANEGGPGDCFKHLRVWAGADCSAQGDCTGRTWLARGLLCEWCNSVWVGAVLGWGYWWLGSGWVLLISPLALSTSAILLKYLIEALRRESP